MQNHNTILIVDDDPALLQAMARLLGRNGYSVRTAESGEECLRLLAEAVPDMVIMDVVLPDADGLSLCRNLKENPTFAGIFVVLISSFKTGADNRVDGFGKGADDYIQRPITNRELLAKIRASFRLLSREKALQHAYRNMEQQKSEMEAVQNSYKLLINNMQEGLWIIDAQGIITLVNPSLARMFRCTPEEMVGTPLVRFVPASRLQSARQYLDRSREGKPDDYELSFLRQDGTAFHALLRTVPIAHHGTFSGALATVKDLSEEKRIAAELKESQLQLIQAQKMEALGTLVSGVAHEINNPNSLIMFNIPLLQEVWRDILPILRSRRRRNPLQTCGGLTMDYLEKKLPLLLDQMKQAADNIAGVVETLKGFYTASDRSVRREIEINPAIESALRLAGSTLRRKSIQVRAALSPDLPPLHLVPQSLEHILINLLVNAAQAIDHDDGEIHIASAFDPHRHEVNIVVTDNGKGISPDVGSRVFDPYFTTRQQEGGTGLGLSVTHKMVAEHGGRIDFESTPGKGTTFRLHLPANPQKATASILVVDDDPRFRKLLVNHLRREIDATISEAASGIAAFMEIGKSKPDLLILDVLMPDMDGLQVCQVILERPELSTITVAIVTGNPEDPKVRRIAELGFTHIYEKPFDPKQFAERMKALLD